MVFHQRERPIALPGWAKLFSQYSGTCTGYGFFGPRVGSVYVLEVDCYDGAGQLLARLSMPPLTHAEGQKRYHTFLEVFASLVGNEAAANRHDARYARAVAQCVARRMVESHGLSPSRIRYRVSASRTPRIRYAVDGQRFTALYENTYRYPNGS